MALVKKNKPTVTLDTGVRAGMCVYVYAHAYVCVCNGKA